MTTLRRLSLGTLTFAVIASCVAYYAWSESPNHAVTKSVQRIVPCVPVQASHAHNLLVRIASVTTVEVTGNAQLLKLEVERYYSKITTVALARAKEHETMRFTILFPASPDADIRPGDLLNYWLVGYTPMRGGNVADNSGVTPKVSPQDGG